MIAAATVALMLPWATSILGEASSPKTLRLYDTARFYSPLKDGATGEVIGGMFQDDIYDETGQTRLGTNQGYYFDFPGNYSAYATNDTDGDSSAYSNANLILFLEEGEIHMMNDAIVSGTGIYERFTGGHMREDIVTSDPKYTAFFTLFEPENTTDQESDNEGEFATETLRVVSEGGYYFPIIGNTTGESEQIGQKFENPVFEGNSTERIGINLGYSFDFPILPVLQKHYYNGNRRFFLKDGLMDVLNEVIVRATGRYEKYTGTLFSERVISMDPSFVSEVTLSTTKADSTADGEVMTPNEGYDFLVTSQGGFYDPIEDPDSGEQVGERFQNPVMDPSGDRIGINQGYGFNFPPDPANYTRALAQGNRIFYLNEGTLNVFNDFIVHATGIYESYTGGRFHETIISNNPDFVSQIKLIKDEISDKPRKTCPIEPPLAGHSCVKDGFAQGLRCDYQFSGDSNSPLTYTCAGIGWLTSADDFVTYEDEEEEDSASSSVGNTLATTTLLVVLMASTTAW